MRKSVQPSSFICRSLKLLLILLLCFVNVSQGFPNFKIDNIADKISGAQSLETPSRLWNKCSKKFVQITKLGSKGVNARGKKESDFSVLKVISIDGGFVRIQGMANNLYLCFNKKGKMRTRFSPPKSLPNSCDFVMNLTGDGYHTFKLRDKPDWSIGFKKRGKKLPGFIRPGRNEEECHHFNAESIKPPTSSLQPYDFNKKYPYTYNFTNVLEENNKETKNERKRKRKIRHRRKKNRRRGRLRKLELLTIQKTLNGVNR